MPLIVSSGTDLWDAYLAQLADREIHGPVLPMLREPGAAVRQRRIAAPFDAVWQVIADLEHAIPRYEPGVARVRVIEQRGEFLRLLVQDTARRRVRPRERKTDAERRVQRLLDQTWPGWRAAVEWNRSAMRTHCTGAIDLPGTTWHDRPAVSRSNTLTVATDQSAAPGLLAEVGISAAQLALQQLGETPGQPRPTSDSDSRHVQDRSR